ncbi:threonine--tRNA ligase [Candidatus Poriferisodalis sp.]|uniref:threonine--tRNA ligase n=1 Tax=Candidatus Poriferisodalis sp. TaxID=3101277 RepID=UPI003B52EE20
MSAGSEAASAAITVVLPDGQSRELPAGATGADLAASLGRRAAKDALIAVADGTELDLNRPLPDGASVSLVFPSSDDGLEVLRHSTAHVLAQAVLRLYPGATFSIGPPITDGFYYDFDLGVDEAGRPRTFSDDDLEAIEAEMRTIVTARQPFIRAEVDRAAADELFAQHPYKIEILDGEADDPTSGPTGGVITTYRNTDEFVDLCRGPHVPDTGRLGHFKLMRVAGAYWRGDEKRQMLQRIYGTAWGSAAELAAHLERLAEAAKRDHRRLVTELDLLSFPPELGGGLAVWHPKGAVIRKIMEDYSRDRHEAGGYEFVYTPHLAHARLFETSGHLDFYAEGMYPPMEMDNGVYYPKPMNCPMHCLIFGQRQRSYRELPLRLFELGTVYRYERSGTLHGLMRIRGFTQDDSHLYMAPEHLGDEIERLLDFVLSVLGAFGFEDFTFKLSTQDPDKFVGSADGWDRATAALREALDRRGHDYVEAEGEAAFYGPKIDIDVLDAIGRSWQLSTIQLDFNLPERFDLRYTGADGELHRPIMIHRALFGAIERFFGVMVEHYGGAFPPWLSPVQAVVLGVRADHDAFASEVVAQLAEKRFRAEMVPADDPLGARIRRAKLEKVPYVLVVGDDDVAAGTVGVNSRGHPVRRDVPLGEFIAQLADEVERKATDVGGPSNTAADVGGSSGTGADVSAAIAAASD